MCSLKNKMVASFSLKSNVGAQAGQAVVVARVNGTSFSVLSGAADTSTYNFCILNLGL